MINIKIHHLRKSRRNRKNNWSWIFFVRQGGMFTS